jgi:RND family efflux transporter MFP subunit
MDDSMNASSLGPDLSRPGSSREKRWLLAGSAVVSTLLMAAAARFAPAGPPPPSAPRGLTAESNGIGILRGAPQWRFLRLSPAGAASLHWTDPVPGRITIDQSRASKVGVPVSGRITGVFVELGQQVNAGERLFSVTSPDLAELRASREKAALDLEAANATLERVQATVASRALPAKEGLAAEQQVKQAEVALRLADAKLASVKASPDAGNAFTVTSPRRGVVVEKNLLVDQQVSPDSGNALLVVADLSSVWVVADVFDAQASGVRAGAEAQITSPSIPDLKVEGKVDSVSAVVDPERHTLPIRVRLDNPELLLRPNVYARVRFALHPRSGGVEVPASALLSDGEHQYVYVQDRAGHFAKRAVVAGPAHEGRIPVLSGLAAGEVVVEEGAILLDNQLALME